MDSFLNKVCIVTGAGSGLGREVALKLALEGAHVIAVGRSMSSLESLDDEVKSKFAKGRIVITALDLTNFNLIDELGLNLYQRYGKVDMLISCAASFGELAPLSHTDPKIWQKVLDINLTANWRMIRSFDSLLKLSKAGRVVFLGCQEINENPAYCGAYTASKAALASLTEIYSKEIDNTNIKVNMFIPPVMKSKLRKAQFAGEDQNKLLDPKEAVNELLELISDNCEISGRIINWENKETV